MSRLVLIDGHAILHRAYHALPPLTSPDGTVINAIYGFMTMLLTVLESQKPQFLAVAFDRAEPTFRMQAYTAYQGKRPEMQSNLAGQIPLLHELLDNLKIPYFEVPGFEADDCIGTLARQATKGRAELVSASHETLKQVQGDHLLVVIVTGDRDMLQLVNSHVKVLVPIKGLSETKLFDEATVVSEFRVKPEQWVDVKALKGDASDNYPGVPGIGPKTAEDLILKYGTLENLYQKLGELAKSGGREKKIAEKLATGAESAGMGKKLAKIVTDVPTVHLDLKKASVKNIKWAEGIEFMKSKFGFKTIVRRIEEAYLSNSLSEQSKSKKNNRKMNGADSAKASPGKQMELI